MEQPKSLACDPSNSSCANMTPESTEDRTANTSIELDSTQLLNSFLPSVPIWYRIAKILILFQEEIINKISYEHRAYESVDEKSLS